MGIKLRVRGFRGQLFDGGEPLGPEFPEFTTREAGHEQIEKLWGRVGLYEFDDLLDELEQLWGTYPLSERLSQWGGELLDRVDHNHFCQALAVGYILARCAWSEARRKRV